MSTRMVLLQRTDGDDKKLKSIQTLQPSAFVEYKEGAANISAFSNGQGQTIDYLLITGGHGDFKNGSPTQTNGVGSEVMRNWCSNVTAKFKAIILDTCFSSAMVPDFSPLLDTGGIIVCAHGSGEGYASSLFEAHPSGRSVGQALSDLVEGIEAFGIPCTSLSIYVHDGVQKKLFTSNAGTQRKDGVYARIASLPAGSKDYDTADELDKLDKYLLGKGISVEVVTFEALRIKLRASLSMLV